jgi:hypothetical protein
VPTAHCPLLYRTAVCVTKESPCLCSVVQVVVIVVVVVVSQVISRVCSVAGLEVMPVEVVKHGMPCWQ